MRYSPPNAARGKELGSPVRFRRRRSHKSVAAQDHFPFEGLRMQTLLASPKANMNTDRGHVMCVLLPSLFDSALRGGIHTPHQRQIGEAEASSFPPGAPPWRRHTRETTTSLETGNTDRRLEPPWRIA